MTFWRNFERRNQDRTYLNRRLSAEIGVRFPVQFNGAYVSQIAETMRPVTGTPEGTGNQHE